MRGVDAFATIGPLCHRNNITPRQNIYEVILH